MQHTPEETSSQGDHMATTLLAQGAYASYMAFSGQQITKDQIALGVNIDIIIDVWKDVDYNKKKTWTIINNMKIQYNLSQANTRSRP